MVTKRTLATKAETRFIFAPREKALLVLASARRPPNQEQHEL
jgi:hypothetical protein